MQNVRQKQTINIGRAFPQLFICAILSKDSWRLDELALSTTLRIALELADLDLVYLGQRM